MLTLADATAQLSARIHKRGLSATEMLMHRDQFSSQHIPSTDRSMILEQRKQRIDNHSHSERSKAQPMDACPSEIHIVVGDLVCIYGDRNRPLKDTWVYL